MKKSLPRKWINLQGYIFLAFFLLVILLVSSTNSAYAQTNAINQAVNDAIKNPNTKVVVKNSTASATPAQVPTSVPVATNKPAADTITIESPEEGAVLVDNNVLISGKSPPGVLVNLDVHDDDLGTSYIKHAPLQDTLGSTTSDQDGNWVFTPLTKPQLGKYWVQASFTDPQKGNIKTIQVHFTVSNILGKTQELVFYASWQFWLMILVVLLLISSLIFFFRKKLPFGIRQSPNTHQPQVSKEAEIQGEPEQAAQSQFMTQDDMNAKNMESNAQAKDRLELLQNEVSEIKDSLLETAKTITDAGKSTESSEKKIAEELRSNASEHNEMVERSDGEKKHKKQK